MTTKASDISAFMAENLRPFEPVAYFDKHMDCIRVVLMDTSVTEERLSRYFTVARANNVNAAFADTYVGFTIKGIAHLFHEIGLPLEGVLQMTEILNKIVKAIPHAAGKLIFEQFSGQLRDKQLKVDFTVANDNFYGESALTA